MTEMSDLCYLRKPRMKIVKTHRNFFISAHSHSSFSVIHKIGNVVILYYFNVKIRKIEK